MRYILMRIELASERLVRETQARGGRFDPLSVDQAADRLKAATHNLYRESPFYAHFLITPESVWCKKAGAEADANAPAKAAVGQGRRNRRGV